MPRRLTALMCMLMLMLTVTLPAFAQGGTPEASDPCANLPASQLKNGDLARVIRFNNEKYAGAYLKPQPSTAGPILRYIPMGTVVKLAGEPRCTDNSLRWWPVTIEGLQGWMVESFGPAFLLEPFSGEPTRALETITMPLLFCIRPVLNPEPQKDAGTPGPSLLRVVLGATDGTLQYSDNGGLTRTIGRFDPPPISVDLAPDGAAALVLTLNGVYWVDILTGKTVFIADSTTFSLQENQVMRRVTWLPDGGRAAVEIEDSNDNITSYQIWTLAVNGVGQPFRVDVGNSPRDAVRRTPNRDSVILISANDMAPYPTSIVDNTPALLEYVPRTNEADSRGLLIPAVTWTPDGKGFYTYIPVSDEAPAGDPIQGRVWYVGLDGTRKDMGEAKNVKPEEYVIPSPDGKLVLLGLGRVWRIQDLEGKVLHELPQMRFLFNWTPDGKGVVYSNPRSEASYYGLDEQTASPYVPEAQNLYDISWLKDGTVLYVAQGNDGKLTFSLQRSGERPAFMGLVATNYSYSAAVLDRVPHAGIAPQPCGS